ncbi:hypothetical protein [Saccharothrix obliqua]|uniref:hypothetical protein n=1 Tax=Saccharothrix obliqua TaxID=2861747 RepID=UPI001C5F6C53|nr:hypothetical protein [Saccharothrix obliqua]MBW4717514.1 hypothetical protein [Saccharothrix obliqua]
MTALLELEPRSAGAEVVEPDVEFEKRWDAMPVDCLVSSPVQTLPVTNVICCS